MFCQEELEHDGDIICFQSLEGLLRFYVCILVANLDFQVKTVHLFMRTRKSCQQGNLWS